MHPLPIIEDILPELSEAKIFSKFDLRNGYWHCNLDEESSNLTTFQTPFGRYKWKRLPFGLAVSSEIFQKKLIAALDGIEGVICVADDILLYGVGEDEEKAKEDHNKKLEILMERCKTPWNKAEQGQNRDDEERNHISGTQDHKQRSRSRSK